MENLCVFLCLEGGIMNGFYLSFLLIYKFFYYNIYSVDNLKNE